jgi:hypothetical protein
MTDVIERLRAANPVRDCAEPHFEEVLRRLTDLPQGPVAARRAGRARHRAAWRVGWRAVLALAAVGVTLAVIGAATRTGGQLSLAARAYAATDSTGVVVRYVEIARIAPWRPHGEPAQGRFLVGWSEREEVWLSGSRSRVVATSGFDFNGRMHPIAREVTQDGSREELYVANAKTKMIFNVKRRAGGPLDAACASSVACDLLEAPDPVVVLRQLDEEGRLRELGGTRQNGEAPVVMVEASDPQALRVYLDPNTGVPVEIVQRVAVAPSSLTMVTKILDYQRLALTAQSERLLTMRPHPHAQATCNVLIEPNRRASQHCVSR